ncbi:hypothetical protein GCM10027405_29460 [Arthrobacter alkaliphilus]|uniref:Flp family type IVb pilin n=1 Tax=Arthrobacter alkaliphilus TaxID=369936 RepID=UPI001F2EDD7B|nr:Flp family type IVb pilin [Arthrobacter alkaliphilus]
MLDFFPRFADRFRHDEKGATAVEYGIMVALIAVVIIVAVTILGGSVKDTFTQTRCSMVNGTFTASAAGTSGSATCSK